MGLQQYAQYQCLGHGAATGRLKLMLLYITVYHLIFPAVLLLNNVFLIKPILYIYVYIYIYIFIHIYTYIDIYMVFKKNHYVTFNHCTSLPHTIFCIMFLMYLNILFYYYVLLPLILTLVTCMYYYCILQAMYGPSLINYCLLSIVSAAHDGLPIGGGLWGGGGGC